MALKAACKLASAASTFCSAMSRPALRRQFSVASTAHVAPRQSGGVRVAAAATILAGSALLYGGAQLYTHRRRREGGDKAPLSFLLPELLAATESTPQQSVCAQNKTHSVYIWIHLKPGADLRACARVAATLQQKVHVVSPDENDDDDSISAGVGFGPNFYKQVTNGKGAPLNYACPYRKGYNGEMPSTGGDIFIHAKCNNYSKLFELTQLFVRSFPANCIEKAEDVYGWTYQEGRDLSGFIDGTENPADEDDRKKVAVNDACGGSYCVTQRWIHDHNVIHTTRDHTLESWVGRTKPDSIEQARKSASSHVARMVGSTTPGQQPKPFEMVRHSQPYGTVCGESGLFFIGYAASPQNLDYMLDRMVGADKDTLCDDIMRLTKCISGTYWYFPSQEELKKLC